MDNNIIIIIIIMWKHSLELSKLFKSHPTASSLRGCGLGIRLEMIRNVLTFWGAGIRW